MKAKKIINILSIGTIIGFIVGFATSFHDIMSNWYCQYKMFRLIAFTFQRNLNSNISAFIAGLFVLYILWSLLVNKMKCDKNKVILFETMVVIIWSLFLCINFLAKSFTPYSSLLSMLKTGFARIEEVLAGEISFNYFLNLLRIYVKYVVILVSGIILLVSSIILMPFLYRLITNLRWEDVFKVVKTKYIKRTALILVVFLAILNLGVVVDGKINIPKGPNVILIVVDALGAKHLSGYGYHRLTSPNIDRLSKDGIIFKKAISQANATMLSMPSMFTSLYPSLDLNHCVAMTPIGNKFVPLSNKFLTITEIFKNTGYITQAVSCQVWIVPKTGFGQGFDHFNIVSNNADKFSDQKTIEGAIEWLDKSSTKKFFLFINLMGPHAPYNPPSPFDKLYNPECKNKSVLMLMLDYLSKHKANHIYYETLKRINRDNITQKDFDHLIALYDGKIRFTDLQIGNLIDRLKALNIYKNTLIILTSDHGEAFLEHDRLQHGNYLYNEEIHVPLIMVFPDKLPRDIEINNTVELVDILPTIANIAGIPISGIKIHGAPLYPSADNPCYSDPYAYSVDEKGRREYFRSYKSDKWSLIYEYDTGRCELYDLENDPGEVDNLIERYPKIALELKDKLFELINTKMYPSFHSVKFIKMSEQMKRDLKSLGYLQ